MLRNILLVGLMASVPLAFGARADEPARPVPTDGQCPVAADERWTPQEKFVWGRVCIGQIADFNAAPEYGGDLDAKRPEGLPDNRVLTSAFIETIPLSEKYRRALTRNGVRIAGARFTEMLDLAHAEIAHQLWFDHSLLEKGADFRDVRSPHRIFIDRSRVTGPMLMQDARIDGDLTMRRSELAEVKLGSGRIGGDFNLDESNITGKLDFNSLWLARGLDMTNDEFGDAALNEARIGGSLGLEGAKSSGLLVLLGIEISGHLIMDQGRFTDVVLVGAHVHGQFVLPQSKVAGELNMAAIQVDGNLAMNDKSEFAEISLVNAHLLGNVGFDSATVRGLLDMTNLRLDGSLDMSGGGDFAEVRLINAHVGGFMALFGSKVRRSLRMGLTRIDGALVMGDKAEFADITLGNAHVVAIWRSTTPRSVACLICRICTSMAT